MLNPPPETKILSALVKHPEKQKLNFSRSALFHMKTRVCLKYFVNDCIRLTTINFWGLFYLLFCLFVCFFALIRFLYL